MTLFLFDRYLKPLICKRQEQRKGGCSPSVAVDHIQLLMFDVVVNDKIEMSRQYYDYDMLFSAGRTLTKK